MKRDLGGINETTSNIVPLRGLPLVEICGQSRVLVENHRGICGYTDQKIHIKVNCGAIVISGENLQLKSMSKEKLVITGKIWTVDLQGRG
jgi:sporulation protein YqfC